MLLLLSLFPLPLLPPVPVLLLLLLLLHASCFLRPSGRQPQTLQVRSQPFALDYWLT
ncbi:uncharacterized protein LOC142013343 [Carettochelys insculpta]|uniref:uncharacterized protein LOC142013343 n=1 Tax=Carettochelys insculpta TaxID=44489 RepID=UPI003EBD1D14